MAGVGGEVREKNNNNGKSVGKGKIRGSWKEMTVKYLFQGIRLLLPNRHTSGKSHSVHFLFVA